MAVIDKPALQKVSDLFMDEGCTSCGDIRTGMVILGPDAIIPQPCGHIHEAKDWLDSEGKIER